MSDTKNEAIDGAPEWFDPDRHIHNGRGVYERETGLALAADGLPMAGMIRAQRLAAAGTSEDPLGIVSAELIAAERAALPAVAAKPFAMKPGRAADAAKQEANNAQ